MAWGVIEFASVDAGLPSVNPAGLYGDSGLGPWFAEPLLWIGGVLLALSLWGQWILVQKHRRITDLSWPWRALLLALACRAAISVLQALTGPTHLLFVAQLSQSAIAVFLFLGLMAARVDVAYGHARAVLAGSGLIALATLWCLVSGYLWGHADARGLLLLQMLPLLMVPAGALGLPARAFSRRDSAAMCIAYAWTMMATWLPAFRLDPVPVWLEQLVQRLPLWSLAVFALLLALPIVRALQTEARRTSHERAGRRRCDQMLTSGFAPNALELVEALPATNRRNTS